MPTTKKKTNKKVSDKVNQPIGSNPIIDTKELLTKEEQLKIKELEAKNKFYEKQLQTLRLKAKGYSKKMIAQHFEILEKINAVWEEEGKIYEAAHSRK